jgi:hypothetical protein
VKTTIQSQNTQYYAFTITASKETGKYVDTDSPGICEETRAERWEVLNISVKHMHE